MGGRGEASSAGKIRAGVDQLAPRLVDLLYTAAEWQPVLTLVAQRPPVESLSCVDQATYRSPFGATAGAGKLLTRNFAFSSGTMSCTSATANGLPKLSPPSVDLTT